MLLAPLVMFMIVVGAAAATEDSDANSWYIDDFSIILALVKIVVLVLGIVSIVYYKDDERVTPATVCFVYRRWFCWIDPILWDG